jgi:hypothetical protein
MTIAELKANYSRKKHGISHRDDNYKLMAKYYPANDQPHPHNNFLYAFLCFLYDGIQTIEEIKKKMCNLFISSTSQVVISEEDIKEYYLIALRRGLIIDDSGNVKLTKEGKKLVEISYYHNLYTSHYLRIFLSAKTVMIATAVFLIIISLLKILVGMQSGSQGMLTEGFENLTDLVKIGIVGLIGIYFKKDKFASVIIICLMMFTGVTLIWSGIEALIYLSPVVPTVEAYIIVIVSIALNAGLAFLKSIVGRSSGNLSLLSDSKDSLLNVRISIGVLIGLTFAIFQIYFVDSLIGIIIAIFVFKEGIEILREILVKDKEFDITSIKVFADSIYDNRLTAYILGSIRRENLTIQQLVDRFEEGLAFGRQYYEGFADYFYTDLGAKTAVKYITKLIKGEYIEVLNEELFLTKKGLKAFYSSKAKEFRGRSQSISVRSKFKLRDVYCIIVIIILLLLVIFGPQINLWISNLW